MVHKNPKRKYPFRFFTCFSHPDFRSTRFAKASQTFYRRFRNHTGSAPKGVRRLYCRWRFSLRPETTYEVLPQGQNLFHPGANKNQSVTVASSASSAGGSSICRSNSSSSPQAGQLISPSSSMASSTSKVSPQEGQVTS